MMRAPDPAQQKEAIMAEPVGQVAKGDPQPGNGTAAEPEDLPGGVEDPSAKPAASAEELAKLKESYQKQIDDLNKIHSKTQSEKDKAIARIQKLEDDLLVNVAKAATPQPRAKTSAEMDAEIREIAKEYAGMEDGGVEAMLREIVAYRQGVETDLNGKLEKRFKERDELQRQQIESLQAAIKDVDPAYLANKDVVSEIQEHLGDTEVSREVLLNMAKYVKTKIPEQPARPPVPGTAGSGVVSSHDESGAMSGDMKELLESRPGIGKVSDAEAKELEDRRKKRMRIA